MTKKRATRSRTRIKTAAIPNCLIDACPQSNKSERAFVSSFALLTAVSISSIVACFLMSLLVFGSINAVADEQQAAHPKKKPVATKKKEAKKILLIGHELDHAWATHMYLDTCELLAKCLRQTPGVEAVVSNGWPEDKKLLKDVDSIVLYSSPGGDLLLDGQQAGEVDQLMKQGVGL
ncbi:MAG: hypothetical protein N2C12_15580, partial [Planctomycetales bacterium]